MHEKHIEKLVIGADTIVVIDNKILGKPKDYQNAYDDLKMLSDRTHFVVTAVAVVSSKDLKSEVETDTTYVTFEKLTDEQIKYYLDNFKPFDKAGSYGIQELPDWYVKSVYGDIDNVIGLPSNVVLKLLDKFTGS